jgi:ABC-2 type transport system permease protein
MKQKLFTVLVFTKLNTRRFFRDKTAIFFTVAFPLIFLFVFGGIFGKSNGTSFKVAIINRSDSSIAKQFVEDADKSKILKVDKDASTEAKATEKMTRGQLDATIVLPEGFGERKTSQPYPTGKAEIQFTQNNAQAATAITSFLEADQFKTINDQFVKTELPFQAEAKQTNAHSLSQFDYTFAGLLGFSIIGMGIFGPISVFPELKKQGILRRFHTTPLRVWQYFLSTMLSQALIGLFGLAIQFAVAMTVFNLNVVGNPALLAVWLVLSIIMILGIGLAVGGWARNERQAAPLANIIVFPMMFLSGTFFPRFLMPEWLQNVTNFLPLTPVIDGIRLIATEGRGLMEILPQLGLVGGWLIIVYIIAFRVFRWE